VSGGESTEQGVECTEPSLQRLLEKGPNGRGLTVSRVARYALERGHNGRSQGMRRRSHIVVRPPAPLPVPQ